MRAFFSGLLLIVIAHSSASFAADVCASFMECGTYTVDSIDDDGLPITHKIIITPGGQDKAIIQFIGIKGADTEIVELALEFNADASFVGRVRGNIGATGICGKKMCTFSLRPMENKTGPYGITGVLRFLGNTALEYNKFVAAEDGQYKFSTVYTKVP